MPEIAIALALPDVFNICMRKDGGAQRQNYFKFLREHCSASMHTISLLLIYQSMGMAKNQAGTS